MGRCAKGDRAEIIKSNIHFRSNEIEIEAATRAKAPTQQQQQQQQQRCEITCTCPCHRTAPLPTVAVERATYAPFHSIVVSHATAVRISMPQWRIWRQWSDKIVSTREGGEANGVLGKVLHVQQTRDATTTISVIRLTRDAWKNDSHTHTCIYIHTQRHTRYGININKKM